MATNCKPLRSYYDGYLRWVLSRSQGVATAELEGPETGN